MNFAIRTDLALETREIYLKKQNKQINIPGVTSSVEKEDPHLQITTVTIETQEGANALNKPIGTYVTIESDELNESIKQIDEKIIQKTAQIIKNQIKVAEINSILVVGLGNKDVTPDALGPKVVEKLQITRHLIKYAPEILPKETKAVLE